MEHLSGHNIIKREMAARLARIEAAMSSLPDKLHTVRQRYETAADSLRLLKAMIAMTPESSARERLVSAAEITLCNLYALADVLSTLVQLELAASDYRVLVGLMVDEIKDSYEGELSPINVYTVPGMERKEDVA